MKEFTFKLPDGVQIPDGTQVGDYFQAMTRFCLKANGEVSIDSVDGESLDPKKEENDEVNENANDDTSQPGPSSTLRNLVAGVRGGQ